MRIQTLNIGVAQLGNIFELSIALIAIQCSGKPRDFLLFSSFVFTSPREEQVQSAIEVIVEYGDTPTE